MNPLIPILVSFAIEQWRLHAGKPVGWKPTDADWAEMELLNQKTAEDYKREARRETLGDVQASVFTDNGR